MLQTLITWLLATILKLGYPGIFLLMAMESSVIPIPSELVMPPAGYWAAEGKMSIVVAILCGTAGSLIGAYANYFVARYLGRPLILKYGKYVWITEEKFAKVETFFHKHGEISTFIGRLLPVVRHLISLPAGLAGMHRWKFTIYTLLGAGLWCTVLALIGYIIGEEQALIIKYSHHAVIGVVIFSIILIAIYVPRHLKPVMKFKNPANGYEAIIKGPRFFTFLFGCLYFARHGVWSHFVISFLISPLIIPWVIYPFFANKIIRENYLRKGWVEIKD